MSLTKYAITYLPLYSSVTCTAFRANAPLPAVKLSPIEAIISISPGLSLWTDVGVSLLLRPGPFVSQKNGSFGLNDFWSFWKINK